MLLDIDFDVERTPRFFRATMHDGDRGSTDAQRGVHRMILSSLVRYYDLLIGAATPRYRRSVTRQRQ